MLREYRECLVAKHWQLLPWEFRAFTSEQQAELTAVYEVEKTIEGFYTDHAMREKKQSGISHGVRDPSN